MNFNFRSNGKYGFGQPSLRHFSTMGLITKQDSVFKPEYTFYNAANNFLTQYHGAVLPNKTFSNPNFVNKQNPNILSRSVAGTINLKTNQTSENNFFCADITLDKPKTSQSVNKIEDNETILTSEMGKCSFDEPDCNSARAMEISEENARTQPLPRKSKSRNRRKRRNKKLESNENKSKPKKHHKTQKTKKELDKMQLKTSLETEIDVNPVPKNHKIVINVTTQCNDVQPNNKVTNCVRALNCVKNLTNFLIKSKPLLEKPTVSIIPKSCPIEIQQKNRCDFKISPRYGSSDTSTDSYSISPLSPAHRFRLASDCDSEDSFIVFCDDAPHITEEIDLSEDGSDTDFEIDFTEKTDDSVDCKKQVRFKDDSRLCTVYPMIKWCYAYQTARVGPWEQLARDRTRFENRIQQTEPKLAQVLSSEHRRKIYEERFQSDV